MSYLKAAAPYIIGLLIGILLTMSLYKPKPVAPVIVANTELLQKVDSLEGIIGIIQLERSESVAREINLRNTIHDLHTKINAFTKSDVRSWIESYGAGYNMPDSTDNEATDN